VSIPDLPCGSALYEVDLLQGILSRQGVRLKIQEQPFRILALLLQRPGEIVTARSFGSYSGRTGLMLILTAASTPP